MMLLPIEMACAIAEIIVYSTEDADVEGLWHVSSSHHDDVNRLALLISKTRLTWLDSGESAAVILDRFSKFLTTTEMVIFIANTLF